MKVFTDIRFHFEFDPKRFTDAKSILQQVKDLGFKVCCWEYPYLSTQGQLFQHYHQKG